MFAEADGVVGAIQLAIVVEIAPAGLARVDWTGEKVLELDRFATILAHGQVFGAKQLSGSVCVIIVELVNEHDIGSYALNDFGDFASLFVIASFEILNQLTVFLTKQRGVVRGDADRLWLGPNSTFQNRKTEK